MEITSLLDLIHRVNQRGNEQFTKLHGNDVTLRQISVLRALQANRGASQTALVQATGVDRTTIAELVKRLAQRGLLKRRRSSKDARAYEVNLTPEGERVLANAEPVIAAVEKAMLETLPDRERETIVSALQRLAMAQ
jgi:DNA-binding MarR family transcriptional regulator